MARNIIVIPAKKTTTKESGVKVPVKKRVAAYCRVSTDQEEQLLSYENQVRYYTEMITKNPEYDLAGIYADEGISGTNIKKRVEFKRMIADCLDGKIDIVITKSISRFARNTLDCLNSVRELKEKGVSVIFEKEKINTMDAKGEVLLTILSSLAQDESRSISENCAWGIRRRFEQGKHRISTKRFLGYNYNKEGKMVIDKKQAKIVKRIYAEFLSGKTPEVICRLFAAERVPNWDGGFVWHPTSVISMLQNERYMGDVILQKSYTADFLTKKRVMNDGKLQKYHIQNDHEPIIDAETWEAVQQEFARRAEYCKVHHTNAYLQQPEKNPFSGKVICGECGQVYSRSKYIDRMGRQVKKLRCGSTNKVNGRKVCNNRYVHESTFEKLFLMSWNTIVDNAAEYDNTWQRNLQEGNALLKYKTKTIMKAVKRGRLEKFDVWIMIDVTESITVYKTGKLVIRFYDGTSFECITE